MANSALIEDLDQRGLLDETLVFVTSEMGRTPRIGREGGRDRRETGGEPPRERSRPESRR